MAISIYQGISAIAGPTFQGTDFLHSNRVSRALQVGGPQQRLFCSLDSISRLLTLRWHAEKNIKALCSEAFTKRFSMSNVAAISLIGVPILHYLSARLEKSEWQSLRKFVDIAYFNIPDFILIASLIQSAVALYFGVHIVQNGVLFSFYLFSFLEQGITWSQSIENQGILCRLFDGAIFRFYSKPLEEISHFSCFYNIKEAHFIIKILSVGAVAEKINRLIPERIKDQIRAYLKPSTPPKQDLPHCWKDALPSNLQLSKKIYLPFEMRDFFPDKTLEELEARTKENLIGDTTLKPDEVKKLTYLIGKEKAPGYIRQQLSGSVSKEKREKAELELKNIFGLLATSWQAHFSSFLGHYDDFVCGLAVGETLSEICLEWYPSFKQNGHFEAKVIDPFSQARNKIDAKIQHILQQKRDLLFQQIVQACWAPESSKIDRIWSNLTSSATSIKSKVGRLEASKSLCMDFAKLFRAAIQYPLYRLMSWFYSTMATDRHNNAFYKALVSDKNLGLTGEEGAVQDYNTTLAADGAFSVEIYRTILPTGYLLASKFRKSYSNSLLDHLEEAILEPGDTRLKIEDLRDYINQLADSLDKTDEAYTDGMQVQAPSVHLDSATFESLHDEYPEKVATYVDKYLETALYNLGYMKPS